MISIDPTIWASPSPHWYWKKDEGDTVSATADIFVNGSMVGSVSLSKSVTVQAPDYFFDHDTGEVAITPTSGTEYWLVAGQGRYSIRGMNWKVRVNTPGFFVSDFFSTGCWHFVQICTPGRTTTVVDKGSFPFSENGLTGLDTNYPYAAPDDDPFDVVSTDWSGWSADNRLHQDGDSPNLVLTDAIINATVDESFVDYLMYLPPGPDSQWVPLHKLEWHWSADDDIPQIDSVFSCLFWPSNQQAGAVALSSSMRWYDHPSWIRLDSIN